MNKGFADLCLTTWLRRRLKGKGKGERMQVDQLSPSSFRLYPLRIWSGRRDLNSRLRPWQGRALPLSYSRMANDNSSVWLKFVKFRLILTLSRSRWEQCGRPFQSVRTLRRYGYLLTVMSLTNPQSPLGADLNIPDTFICNDHIRRIPKRKKRQIVADQIPCLFVKRFCPFAIDRRLLPVPPICRHSGCCSGRLQQATLTPGIRPVVKRSCRKIGS